MRAIVMGVLLLAAAPVSAQEETGEIIVTGSRISRSGGDDDAARVPAIGLRRTADFAVQSVTVSGDTREAAQRHSEIYAMIKGAIELAGKRGGIELATGELVVEPLTAANYRSLTLRGDGRPDTDRTSFLIKTRLGGATDAKAALERITAFIKAVPTVGRAQMTAGGDLTLSIVNPGQYRAQIIDLVAADARATLAKFGAEHAISASNVDRPVEWSRASLSEVFLYVPYSYSIVPRGD